MNNEKKILSIPDFDHIFIRVGMLCYTNGNDVLNNGRRFPTAAWWHIFYKVYPI